MNDEIYLLNPDYIGQTDPNNLNSCQILDYQEKGIVLAEAISCLMTEEINGIYELEMEYPIDSDLAGQIQVGNVLAVKGYWHWGEQHTSTVQLFRIYEINKTINDYKMAVYASHISYDLAYYWVPPYTANSLTQSLTRIKEVWLTAAPVAPWRFGRIRDESQTPFYNPNYRSVRNNLIGDEGSILDVYGSGEYIWDNYDVTLAKTRGADRGLVLRYGVNLSELEQTLNIDDTFSHIFSYWTDYDGNYVRGSVKYILDDPEDRTFSANSRIYGIDASSFFDDVPTTSQLDIITDLMRAGVSAKPDVNIKLTMSQFQDMLVDAGPVNVDTQTYNYQVSLGDTITIQYDDFRRTVNSRTVSARIVKVVYNVITHNFDELEIGKIKPNLDNSVVEIKEALPKDYRDFEITVMKRTNANGPKGLYHELNTNGETVETQQTDENSLSGTHIQADSITANKISVTDLEAFGATIGAFEIGYSEGTSTTQGAIKSRGKTSATDNIEGVYLGVSETENTTTASFGVGSSSGNHITYDGSEIDLKTDWLSFYSSNNTVQIGKQGAPGETYSYVTISGDELRYNYVSHNTPLSSFSAKSTGVTAELGLIVGRPIGPHSQTDTRLDVGPWSTSSVTNWRTAVGTTSGSVLELEDVINALGVSYITARGQINESSGTWTYRCWSDGFREVWYNNASITFTTAGASIAGLYRATVNQSISDAVRNITGAFADTANVQITGAASGRFYTSGGIKSNGTAFEAQILAAATIPAQAYSGWNVYISGYKRS